MGNPNKKAEKLDPHKNRPIYAPGRLGNDGKVSPPRLIKNGNIYDQNTEVQNDGGTHEDKGKGKMVEQEIYAPQPRRQTSLPFKSYGQGTLMTNNFLPPSQQFIAPFPPPQQQIATFPSPMQYPIYSPHSPLNASSLSCFPTPNRIPAPFDPITPPQAYRSYPRYHTPYQGQAIQYQPNFRPNNSGYYPTPHQQGYYNPSSLSQVSTYYNGYAPRNSVPEQQVVQIGEPVIKRREPKILLVKQDKSRKDILIDDNGIKRNVIQVTERYMADGTPYQTIDAGVAETNIVALLDKMTEDERSDFLRKNWIEIFVALKSQENEEAEIAATKKEEKLAEAEGQASTSVVVANKLPNLVTILQTLPFYFYTHATKLIVILSFPTLTNPPIPTGPRALLPSTGRSHFTLGNSTHTIAATTAYQTHPNFHYVSLLVHELNRFVNLQKMEVVLAPPPNMRTPMTLPQLNCFLPFYDLEWTEWEAGWRTTFMGRSEVLKAWPLEYVNGQRERILGEREKILKKLEEEGREWLEGKREKLSVGDGKSDVGDEKLKVGDEKLTNRDGKPAGKGKSVSPGVKGTGGKGKGKNRSS